MIPETWETWEVVVLMGFAGWVGFGACALLTVAKRADHHAEMIATRNRALIEGSKMGPAELRLALGNVHDLPDTDPMTEPANWGAQ